MVEALVGTVCIEGIVVRHVDVVPLAVHLQPVPLVAGVSNPLIDTGALKTKALHGRLEGFRIPLADGLLLHERTVSVPRAETRIAAALVCRIRVVEAVAHEPVVHGLHLLGHRSRRRHPRQYIVHGRVVAGHHLGNLRCRIRQAKADEGKDMSTDSRIVGSRGVAAAAQIEKIREGFRVFVSKSGSGVVVGDAEVCKVDDGILDTIFNRDALACAHQGQRPVHTLFDDVLVLGARRGDRTRGTKTEAGVCPVTSQLNLYFGFGKRRAFVEAGCGFFLPVVALRPCGLAAQDERASAGCRQNRGEQCGYDDANGFSRRCHDVCPLPRKATQAALHSEPFMYGEILPCCTGGDGRPRGQKRRGAQARRIRAMPAAALPRAPAHENDGAFDTAPRCKRRISQTSCSSFAATNSPAASGS